MYGLTLILYGLYSGWILFGHAQKTWPQPNAIAFPFGQILLNNTFVDFRLKNSFEKG